MIIIVVMVNKTIICIFRLIILYELFVVKLQILVYLTY